MAAPAPLAAQASRFLSLDLAKAVSILAVVGIHSFVGFPDAHASLLTSYLRFCVPVFLLASFYISEEQLQLRQQSFRTLVFLQRRVGRLLLPYVVWSIFYLLLFTWVLHVVPFDSVGHVLSLHLRGFGWAGQYYLVVLLQLTLLYPLVRWAMHQAPVAALAAIITLTLVLLLLLPYQNLLPEVTLIGRTPFFYWLFYPALACFLSWDKRWLTGLRQVPSVVRAALLVLLPLLLVTEEILLKQEHLVPDVYLRYAVIAVSAVLFMLFVSLEPELARLASRHWLRQVTTIINKYLLGIFCLNIFVIRLLSGWLKDLLPSLAFPGLVPAIALHLLVVSVVVLVCVLLSRAVASVGARQLVE